MKLGVNKLLDVKTRLWDSDKRDVFFFKMKNESMNTTDLISKAASKLQN